MSENPLQMQSIASGQKSVELGGNVNDTIIITGNNNKLAITRQNQFSFYLLDEGFRDQQLQKAPADFYDGTRPNWANIANQEDSPRNLYQELRAFVEDDNLSSQRMALITGLAGEGKTTLLMRLAWDLAKAGYPVLWRHPGLAFLSSQMDFRTYSHPIILCFDQANDEKHLHTLASEMSEHGIRYIILATSRQHEWHNIGLETKLRRVLHFQSFAIERLAENEVRALIDRLREVGKLGALSGRSTQDQVQHFMARLQADGQLLPALLTARRGGASFEAIIDDVLRRVFDGDDGEFLIRAYAILASVHRFGQWISRPVFAKALDISEAEVGRRVLGTLRGELLEISLNESEQLYTRHAIIADSVARLVNRNSLTDEPQYLYEAIFNALDVFLAKNPHNPQRNLLRLIPLELKRANEFQLAIKCYRQVAMIDRNDFFIRIDWAILEKELGNIDKARDLLDQASVLAPEHANAWRIWATLEKEQGNVGRARELFQRATQADRNLAPSWHSWAILEKEQGNVDKARDLLQRATQADSKYAPSWQSWAILEKEQGDVDKARDLLKRATYADPGHAPSWQSWAILEKEQGDVDKARDLFQRATQADPKYAPSWQNWAVLEQQRGDVDKARELFQTVTDLAPNNANHWQSWAVLEKEHGNVGKARELFQRVTELTPNNVKYWHLWINLEKEHGNADKARALFQKATDLVPQNVTLWQGWINLEKEHGNADKVRSLFQKATDRISTGTKGASLWHGWATFEKEQGNTSDASEHFQTAVSLTPNNITLRLEWALMEEELGHSEQVERILNNTL